MVQVEGQVLVGVCCLPFPLKLFILASVYESFIMSDQPSHSDLFNKILLYAYEFSWNVYFANSPLHEDSPDCISQSP